MFPDLINRLFTYLGNFIDILSSLYLYRGVTVLGVLLGVMVVSLIIGFVFRK